MFNISNLYIYILFLQIYYYFLDSSVVSVVFYYIDEKILFCCIKNEKNFLFHNTGLIGFKKRVEGGFCFSHPLIFFLWKIID